MERKSFSVGVADGVHEFRREAEDKIAKILKLPSRQGPHKPQIYEYLWSQIAITPIERLREFFGTGDE